jgi:hypothetical protein
MENWKKIECLPGYGGIIEVSDNGRLRVRERSYRLRSKWGTIAVQTKPDQLISGEIGTHGYRVAAFYVDRKRHRFLIHRLVAEAFVPGFSPDLSVNHINGIKTDNRAENLEWVTLAVNTQKQWQTGLVDLRGEKHPLSKLTDDTARLILQRRAAGEKVAELANEFRISKSLIYKMEKGCKRSHL